MEVDRRRKHTQTEGEGKMEKEGKKDRERWGREKVETQRGWEENGDPRAHILTKCRSEQ